jgi:cyclopropane fatty-acyl-phospholipid synthase-like methyltransferase
MSPRRNDFDDAYRVSAGYFGDGPERILVAHVGDVDKRRPALDVGAGQGRNAFFLAERGVRVDAIDPSAEAVRAIETAARARKLPVRAVKSGFERFVPEARSIPYGAICLFGLIQLLDWDSIDELSRRVKLWTAAGSVVFLTAFTTGDPSFESCAESWSAVGKNSFADSDGAVRTFLEPGEARRIFPGFEVVHRWEGTGPQHRHGDGPVHHHAMTEWVLKRSEDQAS